jgi:hypothetical protein
LSFFSLQGLARIGSVWSRLNGHLPVALGACAFPTFPGEVGWGAKEVVRNASRG